MQNSFIVDVDKVYSSEELYNLYENAKKDKKVIAEKKEESEKMFQLAKKKNGGVEKSNLTEEGKKALVLCNKITEEIEERGGKVMSLFEDTNKRLIDYYKEKRKEKASKKELHEIAKIKKDIDELKRLTKKNNEDNEMIIKLAKQNKKVKGRGPQKKVYPKCVYEYKAGVKKGEECEANIRKANRLNFCVAHMAQYARTHCKHDVYRSKCEDCKMKEISRYTKEQYDFND